MGKPLFEHETCSRCGGSGHYSRCERYGTTCFKCGGSGWQLTGRGTVAQRFFVQLLSKRAADVLPGERIRVSGFRGAFTVRSVGPDELNPGLVHVDCEGFRYHTPPDYEVRLEPTPEIRKEMTERALAYQATLTKAGTIRKHHQL